MAGRMSRWDELEMDDKLILIEGWARDGDTDKTIAEKLGVSVVTLNKWKIDKPLFLEVLKKGKEVIDRQVENALLKRAIGYEFSEITEIENPDGTFTRKMTMKQMAPDTTAQIFWLKNRKPKQWRDKQDIEHSGNIDGSLIELSAEERRARIDELIRKRGT